MPENRGFHPFVDGRITNPHNKTKNNQQLHDAGAYQKSSQLLLQAFARSEEFRDFAFPVMIAPPLITRYQPGMHYGAHADAAFIQLPGATHPKRFELHHLPQRSQGL